MGARSRRRPGIPGTRPTCRQRTTKRAPGHKALQLDLFDGWATNEGAALRNLAPMISYCYLADLLERILNPALPHVANSDGEDLEFMRVVYRLTDGVTARQVRAALDRRPELAAESGTFWNWPGA